jgi:uncharacterized protein (UPF0332 family)
MTMTWSMPMGRAREEIRAAQVLLDAGLASQAVSCACAAGLHAASAALSSQDATPDTEAGVAGKEIRSAENLVEACGRLVERGRAGG